MPPVNPFHAGDQYPFLEPLQQYWQAIRDEWLERQDSGEVWHQRELHNDRWRLNILMHCDEKQPAWDLYPFTTSLLEQIPGLYVATFSVMEPGCVIRPHRGYQEVPVWRSHLGLVCPPGASIAIAGHSHEWKTGELVVFDDRRRHSASNPTEHERVVLIVDFRQ